MPRVQFVYDTGVGVPDRGVSYFHCNMCIEELQSSGMIVHTSPKEYARQQVAITPTGLQVWCTRHDINIASITVRIGEGA